MVLGATGNVGGCIVHLLVKSPLCKKVVVVTRRKTDAFVDLKVSQVVVDMLGNRDHLEAELAPHTQGIDVALSAFGVGEGSRSMPGEKEKAVESVLFDFLGVYRPAAILGNSNTPRLLGYLYPLLHWAMPSRYHAIHKNDLARAMVAQSVQAFLAIAQGHAQKHPAVKILEYSDMEPFFIRGERAKLSASR